MFTMTESELEELQNIRKLLMLLLFKLGATQEEVSKALGVSQARVSQMLPTKKTKVAQVECSAIKD